MIASISYALLYLTLGVLTVRFLLPRHKPLNRIWLGLSLGVLEEMWLPALFAFFFGFTVTAHAAAAGLLLVLTLVCFLARDRRDPAPWDEKEKKELRKILPVLIPLTLLSAYLQYTHTMRVDAAGNWHVGQSTYGDLPMHLSFITGLAGKSFPAEYPFFPGARLSYPFLTDSLSSTFYLLGSSLQAAVTVPGTLMMALCFMGVLVLAREMTAGGKAVILAALLFFLNGGLGFLYDFDLGGAGRGPPPYPGLADRIRMVRDRGGAGGGYPERILQDAHEPAGPQQPALVQRDLRHDGSPADAAGGLVHGDSVLLPAGRGIPACQTGLRKRGPGAGAAGNLGGSASPGTHPQLPGTGAGLLRLHGV